MRFAWDPKKDEANRRKHGIGFDEAKELLESGSDYLEIFDEAHAHAEDRFIAIGPIRAGIVVVVWTERIDETIRVISARWATPRERELLRKFMETSS